MQTNLRIALAASGGLLMGAAIMQATHAQQVKAPPAYVIAEVEKDPTKAQDPAAARRYAEAAPRSWSPSAVNTWCVGVQYRRSRAKRPKATLW